MILSLSVQRVEGDIPNPTSYTCIYSGSVLVAIRQSVSMRSSSSAIGTIGQVLGSLCLPQDLKQTRHYGNYEKARFASVLNLRRAEVSSSFWLYFLLLV